MGSIMKWRDLADLVRLPAVFTVLADSTAGYLLANRGFEPWVRYVSLLLVIVAFYWAGMVLNDLFDIAVDRVERPQRPLPSGRISERTARRIGWGLLGFGIGGAMAIGTLQAPGYSATPWPAYLGCGLAVAIVAYNGWLKRTAFGPIAMGACRSGSFLLGASAAAGGPNEVFAPHVLLISMGLGLYIAGVTAFARDEAGRPDRMMLFAATAVMVCGLLTIIAAPRLNTDPLAWNLEPRRGFPLLIGAIAGLLIHRLTPALIAPEPATVVRGVRHALLSLIPISAAIAALAAGPIAGLAVFSLAIPAWWIARRLRTT
jgi:4-hydroxybenzoate polyprenyltransferase